MNNEYSTLLALSLLWSPDSVCFIEMSSLAFLWNVRAIFIQKNWSQLNGMRALYFRDNVKQGMNIYNWGIYVQNLQ